MWDFEPENEKERKDTFAFWSMKQKKCRNPKKV